MNTDGTGFYTCRECHQTESLWNHITTDHKEEEQLEDRRNVGENSCNSGDGTDQRVQSLIFMMMILLRMINIAEKICGGYQNTCFAFNNSIFQNSCALLDNFQKPERPRHTKGDNKIWQRKDEICILDN